MRKKNTKKLKIVEISIFVTIVLFVFAITAIYNEKTVKTNTELLSNKKIGWGIKRNDNHEQPDVGSANKNVLEQYNGIALGNNEKKYIYLTFDEGYEAGYTSKILEILKNNQVKATFFITAHYVNTQEELVKQMIEEGHIVGNHTVNHKSMPDLSEEKIKKEILELIKRQGNIKIDDICNYTGMDIKTINSNVNELLIDDYIIEMENKTYGFNV